MIDYNALYTFLNEHPKLAQWSQQLPEQVAQGLCPKRFGDLSGWLNALEQIPEINPEQIDLKTRVSVAGQIAPETHAQLLHALQQLIPWRKGPYFLHGIHLDTEWRSDWKWDRIKDQIAPLKNRLVLDVGCGNGYHCWRMHGAGALRVIGIDPSPRFIVQFAMIKQLLGQSLPVDVLPLGIEALPPELGAFDTTFSMGVFYHRRSPMDHLRELKATLRPGGQLVLETLVIAGNEGEVLVPPGRYAMMNNVWFLPSAPTMIGWLAKCGFKNPRTVDVCPTTTDEQRATDWMRYHSLSNFLKEDNPSLTQEGHPAPIRAVFIAET
ncbi:tRNA 5-methoxyuridine(34)/uridine 5-oxyacetic acid(34) synthase CmoB [Gilvimarinus agarilyticus]|uniref:tRNA 5-methoxyuridine(34)/uridine 5-oxyacetic acid(34) synthase CmoB n=1 Tax=unclassified Gilvimarinus TaxID=2642066 RepID=UPI001C08CB9A|nr:MULTISPECIES: tRNA 5-methoxyuridine(34)/uridine 5-oxyacetic acid(34) synthase CmoB [unclassified Gilvimarinus]MBU2885113.1 tRNA 5-methoxyuridine(34)/uridine 5-oxyacetic acid(34) synthase CmoB [Gilvimarinus agarilyticus]MDO6570011.1 tRNA 5-methoxyuridine(34)/uridine 5-oxyacetic acid(34) synthase CmoB [Gilvimarinus sp. 2_MG-2023]MDO6747277.1 tRNA 5-methoxyuridine(34)/uridine 5-oxyacetic acid(34) synthase CmoB [Gilvimarinus sp. 1_MG-2023]